MVKLHRKCYRVDGKSVAERFCGLTMAKRDWSSISSDCTELFTVFTSVLGVCSVYVLVATSCFRVSDWQEKRESQEEPLYAVG